MNAARSYSLVAAQDPLVRYIRNVSNQIVE